MTDTPSPDPEFELTQTRRLLDRAQEHLTSAAVEQGGWWRCGLVPNTPDVRQLLTSYAHESLVTWRAVPEGEHLRAYGAVSPPVTLDPAHWPEEEVQPVESKADPRSASARAENQLRWEEFRAAVEEADGDWVQYDHRYARKNQERIEGRNPDLETRWAHDPVYRRGWTMQARLRKA